MMNHLKFYLVLSTLIGVTFACGVKGPPLPPIEITPQQSEKNTTPEKKENRGPSPSPSPS